MHLRHFLRQSTVGTIFPVIESKGLVFEQFSAKVVSSKWAETNLLCAVWGAL